MQTDWQAANKTRSWKANQQHMLGYHICLGVGVAAAGLAWWQWTTVMAVSWATHSLIDRRWPVVWVCDHTASHAFGQTMFGVIAVDQAMHLTILCLLSAVL